MIRTVVSAGALACALLSSPVMANEPMTRVEGRISVADLDLARPGDVAELRARVEHKARHLCTAGIDRDWHDGAEVKACQERVVASAESKLARLACSGEASSRIARRD